MGWARLAGRENSRLAPPAERNSSARPRSRRRAGTRGFWMTWPGCLGNPIVRALLHGTSTNAICLVSRVSSADELEDGSDGGGEQMRVIEERNGRSADAKKKGKGASSSSIGRSGHSVRGAPLIFHRSWENRIDNVPHPDAVRGPHTEGIEARNSHSFVAHRERGTARKTE